MCKKRTYALKEIIEKTENHAGHPQAAPQLSRSTISPSYRIFRLIADGVEVEEQADFLMECGCADMQGFLFHKPMPKTELEQIAFD